MRVRERKIQSEEGEEKETIGPMRILQPYSYIECDIKATRL